MALKPKANKTLREPRRPVATAGGRGRTFDWGWRLALSTPTGSEGSAGLATYTAIAISPA